MALSGEYNLSIQISARCVFPVTSARMFRNRRSTSQGGTPPASPLWHQIERNFEFVEPIVARLVHARRLTGRSDEQS